MVVLWYINDLCLLVRHSFYMYCTPTATIDKKIGINIVCIKRLSLCKKSRRNTSNGPKMFIVKGLKLKQNWPVTSKATAKHYSHS